MSRELKLPSPVSKHTTHNRKGIVDREICKEVEKQEQEGKKKDKWVKIEQDQAWQLLDGPEAFVQLWSL